MKTHRKRSDNGILIIGLLIFSFFLFLPERTTPWMFSIIDAYHSNDCSTSSTIPAKFCDLYQKVNITLLRYSIILEEASMILKGKSIPSDIAQDIVGFRALVSQKDAYPILGVAFRDLGLDWGVEHNSTHPPTAFLFVAPIAFLPWNWASAVWGWFMLILIVFSFRCYGTSWKAAIGFTPILLLWPPIATSLSQLTIIWLFAIVAGYRFESQKPFLSGVSIGLASLTKLLPSLMIINYVVKRELKAVFGFLTTWVMALFILLIMHPGSFERYFEVNKLNSMTMILREDNSALLINSNRIGGFAGVALLLLIFFFILWVNREFLCSPKRNSSPKFWLLLVYFSVVLLPISWIYSIVPLLPVIYYLISQKKLSTVLVGCFCIEIPLIIPPYGPLSALPIAFVYLLVGLGLLFDGLTNKLFTAGYIKDLVPTSPIKKLL